MVMHWMIRDRQMHRHVVGGRCWWNWYRNGHFARDIWHIDVHGPCRIVERLGLRALWRVGDDSLMSAAGMLIDRSGGLLWLCYYFGWCLVHRLWSGMDVRQTRSALEDVHRFATIILTHLLYFNWPRFVSFGRPYREKM